jgi:hypothetical protein
MLSNHLAACLKNLFSNAFLDFFEDPDHRGGPDRPQRFPVPGALRSASAKRLKASRVSITSPGPQPRRGELHARLTQPAFRGAPVILRTKARLAQTLGHQLPAPSEELGGSQSAVAPTWPHDLLGIVT